MGAKKYWDIQAKSDDKAEIYLYNPIGSSFFEKTTSAKKLIQELKDFGEVKFIDVHINSPGGSVFDGMAIYNVLKQHEAYVTVYIDGLAASIASVISLAGDKVIMGEGSLYMIHRASTGVRGNINDIQKVLDLLIKIDESMLDIYDNVSVYLKDELKQMMDDETWFTAKEALEAGFADEIIGQANVAASAVESEVWATFKNAPDIQCKKNTEVTSGRVLISHINDIYERRLKNYGS